MTTPNFSQRGPARPLARRVRAYFAPVDRATNGPAIFDAAAASGFALDSPPPPWLDAGWVHNFRRNATTVIETLSTGPRGLAQKQFRKDISAGLEFDFLDWGKLQMALSSGSQQMNLLAEEISATPAPSGGAPLPAAALLTGSTATLLNLSPSALAGFNAGDMIVADVDYQQQTGYIGDIAGGYVADPADVQFDVNYVRRVSFRVARVAGKTSTSLELAQPLLGGTPPAGASVQKVIGFVDREGGLFFAEWSALFAVEAEAGGRIFYHYPRLRPAAAASETVRDVAGFDAWSLHAQLMAMPTVDPNDAQAVLCYRSYVPASHAAVY
jgi:hypothetical protein